MGNKKIYRNICIQDNLIMDSFIHNRMKQNEYEYKYNNNSNYLLSIWSKGYLRYEYPQVISLIKEYDLKSNSFFPVKRRVPQVYCYLADKIYLLGEKKEEFKATKALAAGLWADAVLVHLRMQVLELIESLTNDKRKCYVTQIDNLPYDILEIEDDYPVIMYGSDFKEILKDLLSDKPNKSIRLITHMGWIVLLGWLLEINKEYEYILTDIEEQKKQEKQDKQQRIKKILIDLSRILQDNSNMQNQDEEFPFEQTSQFFIRWSKDNVINIFEYLGEIDQLTGTYVSLKSSKYYRQNVQGKTVCIDLDFGTLRKPFYFLTFSKIKDSAIDVERAINDADYFYYTEAVREGKVVGVSTIENQLGIMLQNCELQVDVSNINDEIKEIVLEI